MIAFEEMPLVALHAPLVWRITRGQQADPATVRDWLAAHRQLYDARLDQYGAVLIRGFAALHAARDFDTVLAAAGADLLDYVGGTSPRRAVCGRVMTATEVPSDYSIPIHQEMSYTANPPERIAFFCVTPAIAGGETTLADMREVTRRIDSGVLQRFRQKGGVQLRRNLPLPEHAALRPGVPKPWTEVFNTTERSAAERAAAMRGWRTQWLDDGSLQLWQDVLPATRVHPRTGDDLWFNQLHIFSPIAALRWARNDGRHALAERIEVALRNTPDRVDEVLHGDGTPVSADDVLHVAEVLDACALPHAWQAGDLLMLDNLLAGHGRRQYNGPRSILAALIGARHSAAPLDAAAARREVSA
ncbi:TauD/TfdA family dioxygenase [Paraburkholderia sediminicola]|uniref:TauD/TfdA family dioxygenase n=1 Tax=Paraburkholderia sediminicola TaxID=458836 RepID=UPI0038B87233